MAVINGLTTLANVKLIAGVPSLSTTYDQLLELLINRVSGTVRQYLDRQLTRATFTENIAANSRQLLILENAPIVSVTSITNSGQALTLNTDYRLDSQDKARGVLYKEDGWHPINLVSGLTMDIMAAARSINVVYVAGYYMPGDIGYIAGDQNSLPFEIQGVVEEMVTEKLIKIKTKSQGLTAYREGDISYSWRDSLASTMLGISDEHALTLNPYKRFVVA